MAGNKKRQNHAGARMRRRAAGKWQDRYGSGAPLNDAIDNVGCIPLCSMIYENIHDGLTLSEQNREKIRLIYSYELSSWRGDASKRYGMDWKGNRKPDFFWLDDGDKIIIRLKNIYHASSLCARTNAKARHQSHLFQVLTRRENNRARRYINEHRRAFGLQIPRHQAYYFTTAAVKMLLRLKIIAEGWKRHDKYGIKW